MARGKKTGGRRFGTPNRATLEKALIAERTAAEARAEGKRLAKEVLAELMDIFAETAERFRRRGDWEKFERWAMHAVEAARALAPFQSPRFSAVMVGASVVNKIEVVGGMPDDFAAPKEIELAPGTIITADDGAIADGTAAGLEHANSSIPGAAKTSVAGGR